MGKSNKKTARWIPVTEALPNDGRTVLITIEPYGIVVPGWYVHVNNTWHRLYQGRWTEVIDVECNVTAWQHFPDPYTAESEE